MSDLHITDEPDSMLTKIGDAAIERIKKEVEEAGATIDHTFLLIHAEGVPEDEKDTCIALHGFADQDEVVMVLMSVAAGIAQALTQKASGNGAP